MKPSNSRKLRAVFLVVFLIVIVLLSFLGSIQFGSTVAFTTVLLTSMHTCPLDTHTFVIAYHDDTNDDFSFQIYDTNGTQVLAETDVDDTSGGDINGTSIGISAFNSTTFVIGWYDKADADATFAIYNMAGTLLSGPTDVDTDIGTSSYSVQVSCFNSTDFVIGWYDSTDNDTTFAVYDSLSTLKAGPIDTDNNVGASQCVSVSTFNSTTFVIGWYDNIDKDATISVYNSFGTLLFPVTGPIDVDTTNNAGDSYSVSVSTLNGTYFAVEYYSQSEFDATYVVYDSGGTEKTVGWLPCGGTSYSGQVVALNSTALVRTWYDATSSDYDLSFETLFSNGTVISTGFPYPDYDIESWSTAPNTPFRYHSLCSQETANNIKIYNDNWIIVYGNTTTQAIWKAFYPNGTAWDGTVPSEILAEDYVDSQSNVDSSADIGTHSSFVAQQATDWVNDTLTEGNVGDSSTWWNTSWTYRKSHLIQNSTGADTNYQVKIIIINGSNSDSGGTVYINNKARTDFGDVRFIASDNTTALDFWQEEVNTGINSTFWVEITGNLTSTNQTIWIYYGNSGVTTTSNGYSTFLFFDDFSGSSLNTTNWDQAEGSSTISGGYLNMTGHSSISSDNTQAKGRLRVRMKIYTDGDWWTGWQYALHGGNWLLIDGINAPAGKWWGSINTGTRYDTASYTDDTNWHVYEIDWTTSNETWYQDGTNKGSLAYDSAQSMKFWLEAYSVGSILSWDFIFRSKFILVEPSHSTWTSEETMPTNYRLDIEEQFTSANYTRTNRELCIRMGAYTNAEVIYLQWWNTTSSTWLTITGLSSLTASAWNNVSVTTYLTAATFTIRFLDGTQSSDTVQSTWQKDACLLHTWEVEEFSASITVQTTTHSWSVTPTQTNVTINEAGQTINFTVTANVNFTIQAKSVNATLINGSNTIALSNLLMSQSVLASAIVVTTNYQNVPGLTNQASGTSVAKTLKLWLTVPAGTPTGDYVYTFSLQVIQS